MRRHFDGLWYLRPNVFLQKAQVFLSVSMHFQQTRFVLGNAETGFSLLQRAHFIVLPSPFAFQNYRIELAGFPVQAHVALRCRGRLQKKRRVVQLRPNEPLRGLAGEAHVHGFELKAIRVVFFGAALAKVLPRNIPLVVSTPDFDFFLLCFSAIAKTQFAGSFCTIF